ncbi:hypothetical protein V6N11_081932 [Hibiscus sabdariffa]|uniref:Uncharacterized protein n=1 Tax=Hibiscus sabdariffa TaxID=183260 RepID=A0ABR2Q7J5_9ROSI
MVLGSEWTLFGCWVWIWLLDGGFGKLRWKVVRMARGADEELNEEGGVSRRFEDDNGGGLGSGGWLLLEARFGGLDSGCTMGDGMEQ